MRVLGIELTKTELNWVILNGTKLGGSIEHLPQDKMKMPLHGQSFIENLVTLKNAISLSLKSKTPDKIVLIGAVVGGKYSASSERVKMECIVELAAYEAGIECVSVSPQTVSNIQKKKFQAEAGKTLEDAFGGGSFSPKYLESAAYSAWSALP